MRLSYLALALLRDFLGVPAAARSLASWARVRTGTPVAHTACEFEGFCDACLFHAVAAGQRTFMMATGRSAAGVRGGAGEGFPHHGCGRGPAFQTTFLVRWDMGC